MNTLINLFWREAGYAGLRWVTAETPAAHTVAVAREMVRAARAFPGVHQMRVRIQPRA